MPDKEREPVEQSAYSLKALANLIERIAPWLLSVGGWIFGGLLGFNLIVISALITVRPFDRPMLVALGSFVCALPLNVAGMFLLRLFKDMKEIGIDDLTLQAFQQAGFPDIEAYFPPIEEKERRHNRRSGLVLGYSLGIAVVSIALTLVGFVAALWHVVWWMGIVLLAMVILCAVLVMVVFAHSLAPESEAEKELKRRYLERRTQQERKGAESD